MLKLSDLLPFHVFKAQTDNFSFLFISADQNDCQQDCITSLSIILETLCPVADKIGGGDESL